MKDFVLKENESVCPVRQVPNSCHEVMRAVTAQVDLQDFQGLDYELAKNICTIIADIYLLAPDAEITIEQNKYPAAAVQTMYLLLTHEHVQMVIDAYKTIHYPIKRIKTYLRTALYNTVMEFDAHIINQIKTEMR